MNQDTMFVGLDVHKKTIAVAVADARGGEARAIGTIPNTPEAVRKLVHRYGPAKRPECGYEAGSCGYVLHRQLSRLGARCVVVAPSLVPTKPGDRVKTDRRDASNLARLLRSGDLTPVWVPDEDHEALRDPCPGPRGCSPRSASLPPSAEQTLAAPGHLPPGRRQPLEQRP